MAPRIEPLTVRKLADRSAEDRVPMVAIPAAAVVANEDGTLIVPIDAGERILVNPDTEGYEHEPWPLLGLEVVGDPPKRTRVAASWVRQGVSEGWISLKNERPVHKPGGPAADPWRVTHTFIHADELVLRCVEGDVRYRIVRQPDKYDGGPENGTGKPTDVHAHPETSVDWFYDLELVN